MPAQLATRSAFRGDIEGLRAIAVLPVVAFHLSPHAMPGGFVGVDVFFVISGYLITGLLLHRLDERRYSTLDFYAARVRRIFPALFAMLLASCIAFAWVQPPKDYAEFGRTVVATALFFSNFEFSRLADYFGGTAELKPLLHTWSLAVEEQFYIVFPIMLAAAHRWGRVGIRLLIVMVAVLSFLYSLRITALYPVAAFYSPLTRAHELAMGAAVAVGMLGGRHEVAPASRPSWEAASLAGLLLILVPLAVYSTQTPFPGWAASVPAAGAALILAAGQGGRSTFVSRAIANRPFRWFGRISYSLYLWHWPVIVLYRCVALRPPEGIAAIGCAAGSVLLAALSYRFIETPFRMLSIRRRPLLWRGAAMMLVAVLVGTVIKTSDGWIGRFDEQALQLFAAASDSSPARLQCHAGADEAITYSNRCVMPSTGDPGRPLIVVWGDSHGVELAFALSRTVAARGASVMQITSSSCPPAADFAPKALPLCAKRNAENLRELATDPRVRTVVLAAYFSFHMAREAERFEVGLREVMQVLAAAGKEVILIAPFPRFEAPVPAALGMLHFWGGDSHSYALPLAELDEQRRPAVAMIERARRGLDVQVVDPAKVLCTQEACPAADATAPLYFDEHHVSVHGASLVANALMPLLDRNLTTP